MNSNSLKHLSDFKALAESNLSKNERDSLLSNPQFFSAPDSKNYQSIQDHSEYVDKIIGFKIFETETKLKSMAQVLNPLGSIESWGKMMHEGSQSWVGLNPRQLLTPYNELMDMGRLLLSDKKSRIIDLGAGYARMAYVVNLLSPNSTFLGFEIVNERVEESNRQLVADQLFNSEMQQADLSAESFEIPIADIYLLYDYGTVEHIKKTINHLQLIARDNPLKIIGRGRLRSFIQQDHPWLSQVYTPHHEPTFSIYSSF